MMTSSAPKATRKSVPETPQGQKRKSRSMSRDRQRFGGLPTDVSDELELTTTNLTHRAMSLTSSFSEIAIDAWKELGKEDLVPGSKERSSRLHTESRNEKPRTSHHGQKQEGHSNASTLNSESARSQNSGKVEITYMSKVGATNRSSAASFGSASATTSDGENEPVHNNRGSNRKVSNGTTSKASTGNANGSWNSRLTRLNAGSTKSKLGESSNSIKMEKRTASNSQKTEKQKAMKEYGNKLSQENRDNRRRSTTPPPGKHLITVFDGPVRNKGTWIVPKTTPLHCEFVQAESSKKRPTRKRQVLVNDKEYRLLKQFLPPLQKKSYQLLTKTEDEVKVKTLFGWVSGPPKLETTETDSQETILEETSGTNIPEDDEEIPLPMECLEALEESPGPSYHDLGVGTTNSEFLLKLAKTASQNSETQTLELSESEWMLMQTYGSETPSGHKLEEGHLATVANAMRESVLSASETSVVLMKTIFKSALNDPASMNSLSENVNFQEFINTTNETHALEKASHIFSEAHESIQNYLSHLRREKRQGYEKPSPNVKAGSATLRTNRASKIANTVYKHVASIAPVQATPRLAKAAHTKADEDKWTSNPQHFQLSINARPGIIAETIYCNSSEFVVVYSGDTDRINLLESAVREKSEAILLHPQRLLEMIDRSATFASGRIISSKYYMSFVASHLSAQVRSFVFGKLARRISTAINRNIWDPRLVAKLQGLNVFSGIILQTATEFFKVIKKVKAAIEKALELDDVLRIPKLPGFTAHNSLSQISSESINITQERGLPLGTKMPMKGAITDLSTAVKEIDTILITIKNSLESLKYGVKVKKTNRKRIEYFFMAVKQLEFGHDIDFGTVIMSLSCNVALVQSLLHNIVPTVDVEVRSRILGNLGHLNWGSGELVKLVKKTCLLSSFVCVKSIGKLRKMIIMKRIRSNNKYKWFLIPRKYSSKSKEMSLKANVEIVDEKREETETEKLKQLKEDLAKVDTLT